MWSADRSGIKDKYRASISYNAVKPLVSPTQVAAIIVAYSTVWHEADYKQSDCCLDYGYKQGRARVTLLCSEYARPSEPLDNLLQQVVILGGNGDNTLPNLRRDEEHWKVVLTEEEFQKRMFEEE